MNTSNINLNDLYYEYKVLTKIEGEPTFDSLMVLFQKLKVNTTAVLCTLGGRGQWLSGNGGQRGTVRYCRARNTVRTTDRAKSTRHRPDHYAVPDHDGENAI